MQREEKKYGKLLSQSRKTEKGEIMGYRTWVQYLLPADWFYALEATNEPPDLTAKMARKTLCPMASPGCRLSCLSTSGQLALDNSTNAQWNRTYKFHFDRKAYENGMIREIEKGIFNAANNKDGGIPAPRIPVIRMNGTSDLPWEGGGRFVLFHGKRIMDHFPEVQLYDYTKIPTRIMNWRRGRMNWPDNYHLTFSASENNMDAVFELLSKKLCNVTMVFPPVEGTSQVIKGFPTIKAFPESYGINGKRFPVINGDEHDLRFLDDRDYGQGNIVGLTYKKARGTEKGEGTVSRQASRAYGSGFIYTPNPRKRLVEPVVTNAGTTDEKARYTASQVVFNPETGEIYA